MIDMLFGSAACHFGAEGDGNPIFVRSADVENIVALKPLKTGIAIGRKISPCNMAKMQRSIGIGKRRSDEYFFSHSLISASSS